MQARRAEEMLPCPGFAPLLKELTMNVQTVNNLPPAAADDAIVRRLSARATRGFLARTERSTLRFVTGFQDCLRAHLSKMEKNDFHDSANTDQLLSVAAE
jgi:hypothetical protein